LKEVADGSHRNEVDHVCGAVVDLYLEAHVGAVRIEEKTHRTRERVAVEGEQRNASIGRFRDAHLDVSTKRQREGQRLSLLEDVGGSRLRSYFDEARRQLIEMRAEVLEQLVRIEPAPLDVGPEALPNERADPVLRP
jgi:hypothetical protein